LLTFFIAIIGWLQWKATTIPDCLS